MADMLPLPPFELHQPTTVEAATRLLADQQGARLISGGTDLLPSMKGGLFSPPHLVSTRRIDGFSDIHVLDNGLSIGAGATLREVAAHPRILGDYPALVAAARTVATPTVQAMATLGGNLLLDTRCLWYNQSSFWRGALGGCLKCDGEICHVAPQGTGCYAAHSADTVPTLLLLEAQVELASIRGTRQIPLDALYLDDGMGWLSLEPGEILTRILLPPAPRARLTHRKLRARGAIDYPLLLTATRVDLDDAGTPTGGRVVLSALGPRPVEISGVGPLLAAGDHAGVAEAAWREAAPLSTHTWPSTWRKKMVRVEVQRALSAG
jgi:4-hydroxybenzoyl-CoA reductase subunit beta